MIDTLIQKVRGVARNLLREDKRGSLGDGLGTEVPQRGPGTEPGGGLGANANFQLRRGHAPMSPLATPLERVDILYSDRRLGYLLGPVLSLCRMQQSTRPETVYLMHIVHYVEQMYEAIKQIFVDEILAK